ncbi:MAG: FliB family protein [Clostridium sp.]|nr:FliB family protein [Clostridium sp.]
MKNMINLEFPLYIEEFKCIGGSCTDSCCIGWDIDIDKITFKQYFKVKDQELKRMFQKNIHNNEYATSDDVDYGKVKLGKDKRCPFLDDNNYCIIHSNLGEDYLSNVCTCYPRIMNKVDDHYEISLDVACPEAARLILDREEGIEFKRKENKLGKHIVSGYIDTKSKEFKDSPIKYFNEIRDVSINIIKNRKFNISERLYILGDFLEGLQEEIYENFDNVGKYVKNYNVEKAGLTYESNRMNYVLQVAFLKEMVEKLDVFNEVESEYFKEHTREMLSGFSFNEGEALMEKAEFYMSTFESYVENIINKNSYIFENYLVNFMYNNLFPFSESEFIFDGYMILLFRYSLIRFYLIGKYLNNKDQSKEDIINFIQGFSKTIEHHKTYLVDVLYHIRKNEFDNIEFAKTLL